MTWAEAQAGLQLLSEERVGRRVRSAAAAEDEAFERTRGAISGKRAR